MSIYKCFLFFLMACMPVNGNRNTALKRIIINAGDDFTFNCRFPNYLEHVYWYHSPSVGSPSHQFISHLQPKRVAPISYYPDFVGPRVTCQHIVSTSLGYDIFSLTVFNMTIADSAVYACTADGFRRRFDARVIGCSCIVTTAPPLSSKRKNVTCTLETSPRLTFRYGQSVFQLGSKKINGSLAGNMVKFSTRNALRENLTITLNPFTNFEGNISCILPALLTIDPTTRMPASVMSTSITTSTEKPTSLPSFKSKINTHLMSTSIITLTEPPTFSPSPDHLFTRGDNTSSSPDPISFSSSSHAGHPFQNIPKETDKQKNASEEEIIIVISAIGSSVILMLVIAMSVLRFHRKRERAPSGSTPGRHETGEEHVELEETDMCYMSIQDTAALGREAKKRDTKKGEEGEFDGIRFSSCGMVDNQLYDFSSDFNRTRPTTDPTTTVDAGGPLYAMPDKASKNRDLRGDQMRMVLPSLSSRGHSDDVTPSSESQECWNHNDGAPHGTDDVIMGDLYAVPDKGPGLRKGVAHYTPEKPGDNYDKGRDVRALYAVVNRSSKVAKEESRDVSDLYAVVDKRNKNE